MMITVGVPGTHLVSTLRGYFSARFNVL